VRNTPATERLKRNISGSEENKTEGRHSAMPTVAGLTTADSKVSKNDSMGGKNRLDTISKRNHHAYVPLFRVHYPLIDSHR
jgi:hypothetical protein